MPAISILCQRALVDKQIHINRLTYSQYASQAVCTSDLQSVCGQNVGNLPVHLQYPMNQQFQEVGRTVSSRWGKYNFGSKFCRATGYA